MSGERKPPAAAAVLLWSLLLLSENCQQSKRNGRASAIISRRHSESAALRQSKYTIPHIKHTRGLAHLDCTQSNRRGRNTKYTQHIKYTPEFIMLSSTPVKTTISRGKPSFSSQQSCSCSITILTSYESNAKCDGDRYIFDISTRFPAAGEIVLVTGVG